MTVLYVEVPNTPTLDMTPNGRAHWRKKARLTAQARSEKGMFTPIFGIIHSTEYECRATRERPRRGQRRWRSMTMGIVTCVKCGIAFDAGTNSVRRYCTPKCRTANHNDGRQSCDLKSQGISSGTIGAAAELIASVDLIRRGWDVYRAVSQSAPCDLVALRGEQQIRVEVRSGYFSPVTNLLTYAKPQRDIGRFDHYAVVVGLSDVYYFPALTERG